MLLTAEGLKTLAGYVRKSLNRSDVPCRRVLYRPRWPNGAVNYSTPIQNNTETAKLLALDGNVTRDTAALSTSNSTIRNVPSLRIENQTVSSLPITCPGCGALSQVNHPDEAGFYRPSRKAVKSYLQRQFHIVTEKDSDADLERLGREAKNNEEIDKSEKELVHTAKPSEVPICDRCHELVYNNKGRSIAHPTMEALAETIKESPFDRNHVYHVLDAADFPLSLMPKIYQTLQLAKPRSQNRRARIKFSNKTTLSFIITRADLLGHSKEMVDRLMPYFQAVLRSALGRQARGVRLGNMHLVSAKRGWWTKDIKDSIWERGGGSWLIGKVNVGKSSLFPAIFPKGSGERAPVYSELEETHGNARADLHNQTQEKTILSESSLLPPAQPEEQFPVMPIVSHLPGTTASPIRLPFGKNKGELIDLPGLNRGNLEDFVHPDHKLDLVMQARPTVTQHVIKPGQSLILGGGLIRITPELDTNDCSTTMLAYPFVSISTHVTSTDKAIALQHQQHGSGTKSILADNAGCAIKSSGTFTLTADVTKSRAGPLLRAGVPSAKLPFRVYSCDILVEGVGWVELVCQVRKHRAQEHLNSKPLASLMASVEDHNSHVNQYSLSNSDEVITLPGLAFKPFSEQTCAATQNTTANVEGFSFPRVEVFSPNGKHIGQRKPLSAWMVWEEARNLRQTTAGKSRPRKSMKGTRTRAKAELERKL